MQNKSHNQGNLLIVDDEPDNLRLLTKMLSGQGYRVRPAPSGVHALSTTRKESPDLILLDIMMPGMDGYEVCRCLKEDEQTRNIPVLFLSALDDVSDKVKAFQAGGVDYIVKPFQMEEVLVRIETHLKIIAQQKAISAQNEELIKKNALIQEQAKRLELLATRDFMTGLANRRSFLERLRQEETRFQRTGKRFAILMLDIDHFKKVNDEYGHNCGDAVITGVARIIEKSLRAHDIPARWGGEEFVCLLPETGKEGAMCVAEKIRTTMETHQHECEDVSVSITVTVGICEFDGSISVEGCIKRADEALYKGKNSGRNQVVLCG